MIDSCENNLKISISKEFAIEFERESTDLIEMIRTMNMEKECNFGTISKMIHTISEMLRIKKEDK